MSPMPLSQIDESSPVLFHPKAISDRPELAILIARAIAGWAEIEARMAESIVNMLGANAEPTLAMFSAINSASAQLDAIKAVASSVLDVRKKRIFDSVMARAKISSRNRNHLAHRVWGLSESLPDAILLIDNKYLAAFELKSKIHFEEFVRGIYAPHIDYPREKIFVYKERDLIEIISEMDSLSRLFYHMNALIYPGCPWPDEMSSLLEGELNLR